MGHSHVINYAPAARNFVTFVACLVAVIAVLILAHWAEVIIPGIKFAPATVAIPDDFILGLKFFPRWLWPQGVPPCM